MFKQKVNGRVEMSKNDGWIWFLGFSTGKSFIAIFYLFCKNKFIEIHGIENVGLFEELGWGDKEE
jgi:hypothetical protein